MSSGKAWGVEPPDSLSAGKLTGNFREFRPILTFWDGFGSRSPSGFSSLQSNSLLPGNRESFAPNRDSSVRTGNFQGGAAARRVAPPQAALRLVLGCGSVAGHRRSMGFVKLQSCGSLTRPFGVLDRHGHQCHAVCTPRPAFIETERPAMSANAEASPNHLEQSAIGVLPK